MYIQNHLKLRALLLVFNKTISIFCNQRTNKYINLNWMLDAFLNP